MSLCSERHEELCYEGIYCPLCELLKEVDDLIQKLKDLKEDSDA